MERRPLTPIPSPPLPMRNPGRQRHLHQLHHHPLDHPLPLPPMSLDDSMDGAMIPPPLFATKRTRHSLPPTIMPSALSIYPIPSLPPPGRPPRNSHPSSSSSHFSHSPTSIRSFSSSPSSTITSPSSSPPSSPSSRPRSHTHSPTPSYYSATLIWDSDASSTCSSFSSASAGARQPHHLLRRKKSPKRETLRALRAKESEACLQKVYDERTRAYLDGEIFGGGLTRTRLDDLGEE